jgi:urease accessory protein
MSDWLTWQIVDSAFPTGAFAHSWGLEAAWQQGEVSDRSGLRAFLEQSIGQTGHGAIPLVNAAYRSPGELPALDGLAHAFLTSPVANRASRTQGRALVATAGRVWPSPALETLQRQAAAGWAHLAPVTGAVFRALGVPLPTTQNAVLYATARGVLAAAVRLGLVGGFEAQRLQHECAPCLERTARRCRDLGAEDLEQTAPLLDLLQAGHDRLYSRLFQS